MIWSSRASPDAARFHYSALADQREAEEVAGPGAARIEIGGATIGVERRLGQRPAGMLDQRIAERQPGLGVVRVGAHRIAQQRHGVRILAAAREPVGDDHLVAGRTVARRDHLVARLDIGPVDPLRRRRTGRGRARQSGAGLQRIAGKAERERRREARPALPRHAERERGQREGAQRQCDRHDPAHRARPSRRHRISPTSASSTSGIANSGQVVALTVGL